MKTPRLIGLIFMVAGAVTVEAAESKTGAAVPPPQQPVGERPPVYIGTDLHDPATTPPPQYQPPAASPAAATGPVHIYVYEQQPLAERPALISPEEASAVVEKFRTNYAKLGSPRILIYVNRELVDDQSGVKLSARSETVETTTQRNSSSGGTNAAAQGESSTTRSEVKNNYHIQPRSTYSLADRQTVRDVERLMGRPFRVAGAILVDQGVATQMIGDQPLTDLAAGGAGEQAAKDRAAISQVADVVVEVLISSRTVTVAEVSGDKTYTVPDIQATAIRLKDSRVLGQASAAEVMARGGSAGYVARNFGVQDITEATGLALMGDMLQGM